MVKYFFSPVTKWNWCFTFTSTNQWQNSSYVEKFVGVAKSGVLLSRGGICHPTPPHGYGPILNITRKQNREVGLVLLEAFIALTEKKPIALTLHDKIMERKNKRILFKLISKIKKSAINKYPIYGVDEPRKLILHAMELDFTGTYTNIPRVNGMGYCSITLQDFYVS